MRDITALTFGIMAMGSIYAGTIAGEVELKPGTQVILKAMEETTVTCRGTEKKLEDCAIVPTGNSFYLTIAGLPMTTYDSFDKAVEAVKKTRDAELCK